MPTLNRRRWLTAAALAPVAGAVVARAADVASTPPAPSPRESIQARYLPNALAHFNLSAIHPFLDGNGRLARVLHSLVMFRGGIVAPPFASIDEYRSVNGGAYDLALRSTHGGRWQPERDTRPFVRFCLTAHYHQAVMLRRRTQEYDHLWEELEREVKQSRRSPTPPSEA